MTTTSKKLGVAILGSGIFVREEHLPAVQACQHTSLVAVYSRSKASAEKLLADNADVTSGGNVDLYSEETAGEGKGLKELLARDDVDVVIIALPILVQPSIIKQSLLAGKHVLSEKPIAPDLASATELIKWYEANFPNQTPIWGVAENFRFMENWRFARQKIESMGRLLGFQAQIFGYVEQGTKYFETPWRKTPSYQGGFLLDGGVHHTAALQLVLPPPQVDAITHLSAYTTQLQPHLPPKDTISATIRLSSGICGTYYTSFGTTFKGFEYNIATEGGVVTITHGKVTIKEKGTQKVIEEKEFPDDKMGVKQEVVGFAESVRRGKMDERQCPKLAWGDLELIERMLVSGEHGGNAVEITRYKD